MSRNEFKAHVEKTIEEVIQFAESRVGKKFARHYCFNWIGAKTEPVPQEQVAEYLTQHIYVDSEHIYPCFDLGVAEMLDDGRLLLFGYRAGYTPRPWRKNWTGREGPFVPMIGQKLLDKYLPAHSDPVVIQKRLEMLSIARMILNGSTGITEGARQLVVLRSPCRVENDRDILVFVGIDSETDHLPLGDVRRHWNKEALELKDEELKSYETRVRERAMAACKNLISKYEQKPPSSPHS